MALSKAPETAIIHPDEAVKDRFLDSIRENLADLRLDPASEALSQSYPIDQFWDEF